MNAQTKIEAAQPTGLALLRVPFADNQISKKPAPTKAQNDAVKADFRKGVRCEVCGGWHHPDVVHLDYVGHAALTDRLLDVDLEWDWEPLSYDAKGLPELDHCGGLWIRLTILGKSRLGYGSADGKQGGNAIKELIGDALRNAAMRFGAALDLWHKGDLHADEPSDDASKGKDNQPEQRTMPDEALANLNGLLRATNVAVGTLLKQYGVENLLQLSERQYENAVARLNKTLADKVKAETDAKARTETGNLSDILDDDIPF